MFCPLTVANLQAAIRVTHRRTRSACPANCPADRAYQRACLSSPGCRPYRRQPSVLRVSQGTFQDIHYRFFIVDLASCFLVMVPHRAAQPSLQGWSNFPYNDSRAKLNNAHGLDFVSFSIVRCSHSPVFFLYPMRMFHPYHPRK